MTGAHYYMPDFLLYLSPYMVFFGVVGFISLTCLSIKDYFWIYRPKSKKVSSLIKEASSLLDSYYEGIEISEISTLVNSIFERACGIGSRDYMILKRTRSDTSTNEQFIRWQFSRKASGFKGYGRINRDMSINSSNTDWEIFCLEKLVDSIKSKN